MQGFEYYTPTKVFFGRDEEQRVGDIVKSYGATKVLVLYGGGSVKRSGLLDRVEQALTDAGVSYVAFGGVHPNPLLSHTHEAIALAKKEEIDFILAVGGGSVIDEAKAVGMGYYYDGDVWDFYLRRAVPERVVPLGCILTIAAAGSETSWASVITNEKGWYKIGYQNDILRPIFAIMNPELTTMWTVLGYPPTSVAIPLWVKMGTKQPAWVLYDESRATAPLNAYADRLEKNARPIQRGNGQQYLYWQALWNDEGTGYMQRLQPVEDEIFALFDAHKTEWERTDALDTETITQLYERMDTILDKAFRELTTSSL